MVHFRDDFLLMHDRQPTIHLQRTLLFLLIIGDVAFGLIGLALGYWLRFATPLRWVGFAAKSESRYVLDYVPLLGLGVLLLFGTFFYLKLYDPRLLLRPHRAFAIILKGMFFWFCVFLGSSLALKFEPQVSRLFVLVATATTLASLLLWRYGFFSWLSHSHYRKQIVQRVAILGWSDEAAKLASAISIDRNHPYMIVGVFSDQAFPHTASPHPLLGQCRDLEAIESQLRILSVDILVIADLDLPREQLEGVATLCERHFVSFKVIPSFFQIFVSTLRLQTISGVSILGIEALPLDAMASRLIKRTIDITGALVGLLVSVPVIASLAIIIKRESSGPVFFAQERIGYRGQPFRMFKLRSMSEGAHLEDDKNQSTLRQDPRVTRIGALMRKTNLDELPQFWNILVGDMSLVGPRPERPYHVQQLAAQIPHYNPRHTVRPGLTGWAQVNGLRGDTSLIERVKYDLYYIENWSLWFDIQILLLTFVRYGNAY